MPHDIVKFVFFFKKKNLVPFLWPIFFLRKVRDFDGRLFVIFLFFPPQNLLSLSLSLLPILIDSSARPPQPSLSHFLLLLFWCNKILLSLLTLCACPTNNALLKKNFRPSSDAEILLMSTDWACKSAPNVQKCVRDVCAFRLSFHLCMPPLVVGCVCVCVCVWTTLNPEISTQRTCHHQKKPDQTGFFALFQC